MVAPDGHATAGAVEGGPVRQANQRRLTTSQRIGVGTAGIADFFLIAMSIGLGSISLFLLALVLLGGVGAAVFLVRQRADAPRTIVVQGHVLTASAPPVGAIVGRCDLQLLITMPNGSPRSMKIRDTAAPVVKWPQVGTMLPVEIATKSRRQRIRVLWDGAEAAPLTAGHNYPDDADLGLDVFDSPVPPPDTFAEPLASTRVDDSSGGFPTDDIPGGPVGHADRPVTVDFIAPRSALDAELDLPPDLAAELSGEPATQLHRGARQTHDWSTPGGTVEPDPAGDGTGQVPRSWPAGPPTVAVRDPTTNPIPAPRSSTSDETTAGPSGIGAMLVVADLDRSVRFYRELPDFAVIDEASASAVLVHGGGRVLLRQMADMSPVDRRVVHLHLPVADLDVAYHDLRTRGIDFVHRPRMVNRGDRLELWAATFRDPDGHAIALTQWRPR